MRRVSRPSLPLPRGLATWNHANKERGFGDAAAGQAYPRIVGDDGGTLRSRPPLALCGAIWGRRRTHARPLPRRRQLRDAMVATGGPAQEATHPWRCLRYPHLHSGVCPPAGAHFPAVPVCALSALPAHCDSYRVQAYRRQRGTLW
jgi:hypothetical protein